MTIQKEYSIAEAKNKLPSIIHNVETDGSVKLTRYGKPVAVLLSMREYEKLQKSTKGFWNALLEFRTNLIEENIDISDSDFENLRDISAGRKVSFL